MKETITIFLNTIIKRYFPIFCFLLLMVPLSVIGQENDWKYGDKDVFKVVEEMPRFPGCENADATNKQRSTCSKKKMLEYIYKNLKYPEEAAKAGIEGTVVAQFVVKKDGKLGEISIIRDIGANCGEAVLEVLNSMNALEEPWIPGKQRGRAVNVLYTIPVRFELDAHKADTDKVLPPPPPGNPEPPAAPSIEEPQAPPPPPKHMDPEDFPAPPEPPAPSTSGEIAPPPPPPPPPPPAACEGYTVVEDTARFPGCEELAVSSQKKEDCAKEKMLQYIYANLKYPKQAKENKIEGTTVLQFVVEKDGQLGDIKIMKDIGGGCGEAAKSVLELMNTESIRWIPAKQKGEPVEMLYTLPVKFKL